MGSLEGKKYSVVDVFFSFNNCDFVGKMQKTKSNAQTRNNCTKFLDHLGINLFNPPFPPYRNL